MGRNDRLSRNFGFAEELAIYDEWESGGHFRPSDRPCTYYIPMPPPNITGQLHLGHAYFATLQDTIIRHRRMRGISTLWLPGTDHAGLATHDKIMALFAARGITAPTREEYDTEAAQWRATTGSRITTQLRRMGASCDWSRERYTLDDRYPQAVTEAFLRMNEKGLITRRDGQWWLDSSGMAADLLAALDRGEITIIPEHGEKTLRHFLSNIEPWCLSRQIWWGHRIPAWQAEGRWTIARTQEEAEAILGAPATQDEDVLDTWFSSSLWPFAALGWPEDTPDLRRFYPAAAIETGADILFFWCARMLMMGQALTGQLPFRTIYLHGLIRDAHGEKMSKSLNNGIDPLDLIGKIGTDGLRFALLENTTPGQDIALSDEALDSAKRFANKLWQASRFALGHYQRAGYPQAAPEHPDDLRILSEAEEARSAISGSLERWEFRQAAATFRAFFKDRFCDWYIEAAKDRLYGGDEGARRALLDTLDQSLRMAHPMLPFTTERIRSAYSSRPLISEEA